MGRFARREMRLAWYRSRATFSHRGGSYLAIIVLVGLVGGLALASIAAARRTASSPAVYYDSSNLSDLIGASGVLNPTIGQNSGYDPALVREISRLPHVKQVQSQAGIDFLPLNREDTPLHGPNFYPAAAGNGYGSVDGLYFDQDRVTVTKGRLADPNRADEMMLTAQAAKALYVHVGSVLPVGIYTNAQTQLPAFGTPALAPVRWSTRRWSDSSSSPPRSSRTTSTPVAARITSSPPPSLARCSDVASTTPRAACGWRAGPGTWRRWRAR